MGSKYIDKETGEIKHEPEFVKLYINKLCAVKGLSGLQHEMFKFMLGKMDHENVVSYGSVSKRKFLDKHNVTSATFNNNIKALIKAELMERIALGEFRINKKYATKVEWSKVQSIEWKTTFSRDGEEEEIEITKK